MFECGAIKQCHKIAVVVVVIAIVATELVVYSSMEKNTKVILLENAKVIKKI